MEGNITFSRTTSVGSTSANTLFVASNGDIYVYNNATSPHIDKYTQNQTNGTVAMYVAGTCYGIFIDIQDNLYCSMESPQQVVKKSLKTDANDSIIVAGNGNTGSGSYMLNGSRGIVVDIDLNLYVADSYNHRIQLFRPGQLNGTTIVINGSNGTLTLNTPTAVALDGDGYLFITDYNDHRILGSGPGGFRCIVGCTGVEGAAANQLNHPHRFNFDTYGNLYVIDISNRRLQKFFLSSNSCGEFYQEIVSM